MHCAVLLKLVRLLLDHKADVNAKNKAGATALMWAVEQRHPGAVKTLVELGADVGARSGPAGLPRNYMAPRVDTARTAKTTSSATEGAADATELSARESFKFPNETGSAKSVRRT